MGHGLKECDRIPTGVRDKLEDELSYSLALKDKSNLLQKECLEFGASTKNFDEVDGEEGMFSTDVTSSQVTVANCQTEVRGGSTKVLADMEATNFAHNSTDFGGHRIPPIKDEIWGQ
ncbi:hypothetical protein ES288_D09G043000v1 [Gossypium darwinii]|uniref:Uncharacterized protein n=1 Tax=Gossypium darwinii TaxID=34276 RepID=A0A5D2B932_GOSDA|nr:hypothetical protein ES288_D09G043000v1 [Gossypium darwinii]